MNNILTTIAAIVFCGACCNVHADQYGSVDIKEIVRKADIAAIIRITSAKDTMDKRSHGTCRYQYTAKIISNLSIKNNGEEIIFSTGLPMLIGNRYVAIAKYAADICGDTKKLSDAGIYGLFPVIPYGYDSDVSRSWIVFSDNEFIFPKWLKIMDLARNCAPVDEGVANLCLSTGPIVRLDQFIEVLGSPFAE